MPNSIMDFVPRFREYQATRDSTEMLIKDLMIFCESTETTLRAQNTDLATQLANAKFDYDDAVKSRRELQQRIRELEYELSHTSAGVDGLKHRNPYVVVLIDGDGLLFQDHLVRLGHEGGKKAAYALREAVLPHCDSKDTEVVAKIVANLQGLSRATKRDGSLYTENELRGFLLGFTQAKALFEFVDVGLGKGHADIKIKETARWNLRNYSCKQIFLGISHDAGYAPFLDEVVRDYNGRRRVTILEGYPTVKEIIATDVSSLCLDRIFRVDKVGESFLAHAGSYAPSSTAVSISSTPGNTPKSFSYATVTQNASPPPQITLPLAPRNTHTPARVGKATPVVQPPWNPGPRGLDTPIQINQAVLDQIKKRKDNDKLCNNHYLRGPCAKGDQCCFEHDYKPNAEEIKAISFLARLNPCTNGQDCDVDNCIYGHHCPSVQNGACTHPYCKFRIDEHPPGTKTRVAKKTGYDY